jgi:hypothetical protein
MSTCPQVIKIGTLRVHESTNTNKSLTTQYYYMALQNPGF